MHGRQWSNDCNCNEQAVVFCTKQIKLLYFVRVRADHKLLYFVSFGADQAVVFCNEQIELLHFVPADQGVVFCKEQIKLLHFVTSRSRCCILYQ